MVLELLAAVEGEAVTAINEAYAEGYKAGLLVSAPDAAYWRSRAEDWKAQANAALLKPRLPWWAVPVSASAGAGLAFLISMAAR
ncbi:MAG: hypothetical protein A2Y38_00265 [Spirochaetes bacterium GWB1_59_5]|nr:MAG: hypothetical protein A2Y38_00265 [Spirochaetes bacterium GWB1_59_5]